MSAFDGGVWTRCPEVLWRKTAGGAVLLPPGVSAPVLLNETGAALWALLATPRTFGEVIDRLAARYQQPPEQIAADVETVLADLAGRGAVGMS